MNPCVFCGLPVGKGDRWICQSVYQGRHEDHGYVIKGPGKIIHMHDICGLPKEPRAEEDGSDINLVP